MGKIYYCDYCDRSFKDDTDARKKHLSSLQHVKNRADHYNLFKDPEITLKEELAKTPCKRYMTVGECVFGQGCRYSHYTPPMIWELERLIAMKERQKSRIIKSSWPNPDEIIREYFLDNVDPNITEECNYPIWTIPLELRSYPNLPPSLWPVTPERVTDSNFAKWC